jgi:hemolysin activation/secretion protein
MRMAAVRICCGLCITFGMFASGGTALAQSDPQAPASGRTPLIIDNQRTDRAQPIAPARPALAPDNRSGAVDASGGRGADVVIRGIRFEGSKVPANVAQAASAFVGQRADGATLQRLSQAMSDAYAQSAVALYTILIPDQAFGEDVLRVRVIEGRIEAVPIKLDGKRSRQLDAYAAKLRAEQPLQRPTLERYISLMRDLPGYALDQQIKPGSSAEAVQLDVAARRRKPQVRFAYDNRATQILGDGQFQATATTFGLLRDGDQTDLIASAAPDFHRYRYLSLSHGTALDAEGTRLTLSGGYLRTNPNKSPLRGDARLGGITLSHPLIRSYQRNLTGSLSLDGLNSDNAAFGTLITSERTRAARLAAAYGQVSPTRSISAGATLSRGLDILGARAESTLSDASFRKANARIGVDQALGKRLIARLRASGQYSGDPLPAAERFAVGGGEYGRGFEIALFSADRGAAALAELAWRPISAKRFAASELYGFVDGATVTFVRRGDFASAQYDLASAGGGARLNYNSRAAVSIEFAHPIERPYFGYRERWQVSVGWTLSLIR